MNRQRNIDLEGKQHGRNDIEKALEGASSASKIVIVVPYWGKLPPYFQIWLHSCARNGWIEWQLLVDKMPEAVDMPRNVSVRQMTRAEFRERMGKVLGFGVSFEDPRKLCDFRPLYWALVDNLEEYAFWGHCDLDVIFGDLSAFLDRVLLTKYDRIFSLGHLSLYRNNDNANNMFRHVIEGLDYREILADPTHRAFDEHMGVNRIWLSRKEQFYINEGIVADIDPGVTQFELARGFGNHRCQVFGWFDGKVKCLYNAFGRWREREFIYIHFQKRQFKYVALPANCTTFYVGPTGFIADDGQLLNRRAVFEMNEPSGSTSLDWGRRGRRLYRAIKREVTYARIRMI